MFANAAAMQVSTGTFLNERLNVIISILSIVLKTASGYIISAKNNY